MIPFAGVGFLGVIFWIIVLVVNIAFAVAIYKACDELDVSGKKVMYVDRAIWALSAAVTGLLTVIVFWLIHYSTLAKEE